MVNKGEGGVKNHKKWMTSFMDGHLCTDLTFFFLLSKICRRTQLLEPYPSALTKEIT